MQKQRRLAPLDASPSRPLAGVRIGVANVVIAPEVDTAASRLAGAQMELLLG